jgi:hypothetical protein
VICDDVGLFVRLPVLRDVDQRCQVSVLACGGRHGDVASRYRDDTLIAKYMRWQPVIV